MKYKRKRVTEHGEELPEHIKNLRIPPGWHHLVYNPNPDAALLAVGTDSKGRKQYVYSTKFANTQAEAKFERIKSLNDKFEKITAINNRNLRSDKPRVRDIASCLNLIMKTGIRPGSNEDTRAEKKAYGATTLTTDQVHDTPEGLFLRFVGKKGVDANIKITDKVLKQDILERKLSAGDEVKKLFPGATDENLLDYVHRIAGIDYKTKDFRTLRGTRLAMQMISKMEKPKNDKEYRKAVLKVGDHVAKAFNNTRTVALQSYISPVAFAEWQL